MRKLLPILLVAVSVSCKPRGTNTTKAGLTPPPQAPPASTAATSAAPQAVPHGVVGERPRFSPDGKLLAYFAGNEGAHRIYVANADGTGEVEIKTPAGDSRDPTWASGGARIVFANNSAGTYDLFVASVASSAGPAEKITSGPGDDVEPSVASIPFGFYAIGGSPMMIDAYEKLAFTRRGASSSEVWFASLAPLTKPDELHRDPSPNGTHLARISPAGQACSSPAWSGDGLSLVWSCGGQVMQAVGAWEEDEDSARKLLDHHGERCERIEDCEKTLPHHYGKFAGAPASAPADSVARPAFSTNQIVLVGDAGGTPIARARDGNDAWRPIAGALPADARNVVWSPDGKSIAFDAAGPNGRELHVAPTSFYLQEVENLHDFPELHGPGTPGHGAGESARLDAQRFIVRPFAKKEDEEKEFYTLHEHLRYASRPEYITADTALQAFNDELLRALGSMELDAMASLADLSDKLARAYATDTTPSGHYLAVYFGTAWVFLAAGADLQDAESKRNDYDDTPKLDFVAATREGAKAKLAALPDGIRTDVAAHVAKIVDGAGEEQLAVPSEPKPFVVDDTQFVVRGHYADGPLAGYFLAMTWFGMIPLPIDASLPALVDTMQKQGVWDTWEGVDGKVGSIMGTPVDGTVAMVRDLAKTSFFQPFDAVKTKKKLAELRGPIDLQDLGAVEAGDPSMALKVTLFPKRLGLDVTVFRHLTYPDTAYRVPSMLDVLAGFGAPRAAEIQKTAEQAKGDAAYEAALGKVIADHKGGIPTTDLYHAWLALVVGMATANDVPADSIIAFTKSPAWQDRLLSSSLGSYVELKHATVLYAQQDYASEGDGGMDEWTMLAERPIIPAPRGYVDPMPSLFIAISNLADRLYKLSGDADGPDAHFYGGGGDADTGHMNVRAFAIKLAQVAAHEVAGTTLTDDENSWIDDVGERLEALTFENHGSRGNEIRKERGIVLATDVHNNVYQDGRRTVLEIGIGHVDPIFVAVPNEPGQRMTEGGVFSIYEFESDKRLTDEDWAKKVEARDLPPRPAWTASFVEPPRK